MSKQTRLDPQQHEQLRAMSYHQKLSIAELVRQAIQLLLTQQGKQQ